MAHKFEKEANVTASARKKHFRKMILNFPIFDRLLLSEKIFVYKQFSQYVRKTSFVSFLDKKFEKISHLRGFISLEKHFPNL